MYKNILWMIITIHTVLKKEDTDYFPFLVDETDTDTNLVFCPIITFLMNFQSPF